MAISHVPYPVPPSSQEENPWSTPYSIRFSFEHGLMNTPQVMSLPWADGRPWFTRSHSRVTWRRRDFGRVYSAADTREEPVLRMRSQDPGDDGD